MPVISTEIYIDGTLFLDSLSAVDVPYEITSTGIEAESEVWTYSGTGTFLGFSTTQGATTPDEQLAVGDDYSFVAGNTYYLYTVAVTATTVDIKLGNNTLLGVDTIALTDATDTSNTINFSYGVTSSGTVSVKLGDNTLTNVNTLSVLGSDLTYKSFGYAAQLGGTISLRGVGHQDEQADSYYSYIKINEAPATAQDYDYMVTGRGYVNSKTQTQITQPVTIEGASIAYLWCDYNANFTCQYKVDSGSYQNLTPFSSPTTLTLTNDIELTLTGWRD